MSFTQSLSAALEEPAIEAHTAAAVGWKARADALYAAWPQQYVALPRPARDLDVPALVRTCDRFLGAIAAHPPELPCHGAAHTIRVMSHAIRLARRDELEPLDRARLLLAATTHDLGRLRLPRDGELRHADVSAVLLEDLRGELDLGPALFRPVQHAVLMHSARRRDARPIRPRVIDDVRSADKLDAIDEIGFVRALLYQGANERIHLRPIVGDGAGVLVGWWRNIEQIEKVSISRRERHLISRARTRARRIGEGIKAFEGPPELLRSRFLAAARLVEPDANRAALSRTLDRLAGLPRRAQANWSGLLGALVLEIESLESRRLAPLTRTAAGPQPDLALFANLVLTWSRKIELAGHDLVA
jgi:HD superfamily phosphodiesterase